MFKIRMRTRGIWGQWPIWDPIFSIVHMAADMGVDLRKWIRSDSMDLDSGFSDIIDQILSLCREIHWDHRSGPDFSREIQWDPRSHLDFCREIH